MGDIAFQVRIPFHWPALDKEGPDAPGSCILADFPVQHLHCAAAGAEQKAVTHGLFSMDAVQKNQRAAALFTKHVAEHPGDTPGGQRTFIAGFCDKRLIRFLQTAAGEGRGGMNDSGQRPGTGSGESPDVCLLPQAASVGRHLYLISQTG